MYLLKERTNIQSSSEKWGIIPVALKEVKESTADALLDVAIRQTEGEITHNCN